MARGWFEKAIVRYALKESNRNRFAKLLEEILPTYTRWSWGDDGTFRRYFNSWQQSGFNLSPNHYYSPIPDVHAIASELNRESDLTGIDLRVHAQLDLLRDSSRRFHEELTFPVAPTSIPFEFHFNNGAFERVDAELLHCLVRRAKPKRFIEVGSGYSTLVAAAACELNREESGNPCTLTAIEPNPRPFLEGPVPGLSRLVESPVKEVPKSLFEELDENDILFVDSTHVLKTGSDVAYLFLDVIPALPPGVLVHVHDVFLPAEYPRRWIEDEHVFWNEQYLLQAFLAFNTAFSVVAAAGYLHRKHPDALASAFPGYSRDRDQPGSFWFSRSG